MGNKFLYSWKCGCNPTCVTHNFGLKTFWGKKIRISAHDLPGEGWDLNGYIGRICTRKVRFFFWKILISCASQFDSISPQTVPVWWTKSLALCETYSRTYPIPQFAWIQQKSLQQNHSEFPIEMHDFWSGLICNIRVEGVRQNTYF